MKSPFKFLDAYTRRDHKIFFGREKETNMLYNLANQNRLILVYGPSGTGKTSLIQCGLANRFHPTSWFPLFIRRGENINTSLRKSLAQLTNEDIEGELSEIIKDIYTQYLRPIYLIFDQLEEIFVLGDEEERGTFIMDIAKLKYAKLPCQIIFSLREEYLAHLYPFEQVIPTLFEGRLRVESISVKKAIEVIESSCNKFNISLEDPENNIQQIIDKITAGRSGVSLPYLQVYMDRLYRETMQLTYGNQVQADPLPALEFSTAKIESLGEIGDVLNVFLQEQSSRIQSELYALFPENGNQNQTVRKILNEFASLEGMKIPRKKEEISLPHLSQEGLGFVLDELRQSRILREEGGIYELAHDTLSLRISEQRSATEIALMEAVELIQGRLRAFIHTGAYLNIKELQLIENYASQLQEEEKLSEEAWAFIDESRRLIHLQQRRRKNIVAGVISILAILLAFAGFQWYTATQTQKILEVRNEELSQKQDSLSLAFEDLENASKVIEIQKNTALKQKKTSDSLKDVAENALRLADSRLVSLRASRKNIFEREMEAGQLAIYKLQYDKAYSILLDALEFNLSNTQVRDYLIELIYYFNEAGDLTIAKNLIERLSKLEGLRLNLPDQGDSRAVIKDLALKLFNKEFYDNLEKRYYPELVRVPGGRFWMGQEGSSSLLFLHQVSVDDFWIGRFEMTVFQYELFLRSTGKSLDDLITPSWFWNGDNPIIFINWYNVVEYCNWLSERKGLTPVYTIHKEEKDPNNQHPQDDKKWLVTIDRSANGYRLPTEAEWEYAAGGGQAGRDEAGYRKNSFSGSENIDLVSWYLANVKSTTKVERTLAVGGKQPNELGLYDMSGNVWEWCNDWFGRSYYEESQNAHNPIGPSAGERRVIRGGSWSNSENASRIFIRGEHGHPHLGGNASGFRVTRNYN